MVKCGHKIVHYHYTLLPNVDEVGKKIDEEMSIIIYMHCDKCNAVLDTVHESFKNIEEGIYLAIKNVQNGIDRRHHAK